MSTNNTKRWSTAVHEAAHAIVGTALGMEVVSTCVTGPREGMTLTANEARLTAAVKMALAGMAAEKMMNTGLSEAELLEGAGMDLVFACAMCTPEQMSVAARQVSAMLRDMADALENGACELHAHGCLSGDQVREMMNHWAER